MGRYLEEFSEGETFITPSRTLTESDIMSFAGLTGDYNPVHTDEIFAATTPFCGRIAHGPMMVGMAFGLLSRLDLIDGTVVALKGIDWTFEAPLRAGDTVHVKAQVMEARASSRYADRGVVRLCIEIIDQKDRICQIGNAVVIMMRKP
jgi:acyl dehydratase